MLKENDNVIINNVTNTNDVNNVNDVSDVSNILSPEEIIFKKCLGLKETESCLIIFDSAKKEIADALIKEGDKIAVCDMREIPEPKVNGEEPPVDVSEMMLRYDVVIFVTSKSLSWTKARASATKMGVRIASMPGITREIMNRAIDVDYDSMKLLTNKIADMLDSANEIRVRTELGTDITIDVSGRIAHGRKAGIFDAPGFWGNLPEGEAFICPVEGKTNGKYIVDASQAGVGKLDSPIEIEVVNGFAVKISGINGVNNPQANEFLEMLNSIGDKNAFNIAELGIGTNPKAVVSGKILEDEKILGTCHIALGKSLGFGGNIDVPVHVDGVILKPTIFFDGKMVMENGKLLI